MSHLFFYTCAFRTSANMCACFLAPFGATIKPRPYWQRTMEWFTCWLFLGASAGNMTLGENMGKLKLKIPNPGQRMLVGYAIWYQKTMSDWYIRVRNTRLDVLRFCVFWFVSLLGKFRFTNQRCDTMLTLGCARWAVANLRIMHTESRKHAVHERHCLTAWYNWLSLYHSNCRTCR